MQGKYEKEETMKHGPFGEPLYTKFTAKEIGECLNLLREENKKLERKYQGSDTVGLFWYVVTGLVFSDHVDLVCEMR